MDTVLKLGDLFDSVNYQPPLKHQRSLLSTEVARKTVRYDEGWPRMDWEAEKVRGFSDFSSDYRMDVDSFDRLLDLIRDKIQIDAKRSSRQTHKSPIRPEHVLSMTICYLAGGRVIHLKKLHGLKKAMCYRYINHCMEALEELLSTEALAIKFPSTKEDFYDAAKIFQYYSTDGVINGCVGALDGWFCFITCPSVKETDYPQRYYSGHYMAYGLNVQACCDAFSRFTYASILYPGSTNDYLAFTTCPLYDYMRAKCPMGL